MSHFRVAILSALLLVVAGSSSAWADDDRDRAQWGHSITVGPSETVADVTCFACSVYVYGTVEGDVASFGGRVVVNGQVKGDVASFGGGVRLGDGARIGGDVAVFGSRLFRPESATIGGEVAEFPGIAGWLMLLLPFAVLAGIVGLIVWRIGRRRGAGAVPV